MSDPQPSDEMVSQFLAFTGSADPANATSYLEMSGGNLETAVGLFMEHQTTGGGAAAVGGAAAAAATGMTDPSLLAAQAMASPDVRAPDATRTMRLMDDTPLHTHHTSSSTAYPHSSMMLGAAMEEAAMLSTAFAAPTDARATVNSMAAAAAAQAEESKTSARGTHSDHDPHNNTTNDANANANQEGAHEDDDNDDNDDDDEDSYVQIDSDSDDAMTGPTAAAAPTLSDMFAAPSHLIHRGGGFQGARSVAKDSRRWLLVNLQRDSEFSSHALNRDVWRDELVENLIREGFIFWQAYDVQDEGQTYAQRYTVADYPHVAIIDPRTGRLMWRKEGWTQENPITPESFAEMAMDFCSRHSFDKPPVAPRPSGAGGATASSSATSASVSQERPPKRPFMTEEEQLQEAMRESLKQSTSDNATTNNNGHVVDHEMQDAAADNEDDDDEVEILEKSDIEPRPPQPQEEPNAEEPPTTTTPSFVTELLSIPVGEEPSDNSARIQIRMPDGKRLVRKFHKASEVKIVYAFVAQSNDEQDKGGGGGGREFVLMAGYPPKDLISEIDNSIDSTGLSGQAITVRW
eukprot:CAMPEP_0195295650 /NCGR_PEP_ID=MMETSP0707-20130614/17781_1 /TAXON_ID=33640 /ORGANISM="Asterionellopsis glacialis, Strain CCMP134" /LENGTH=574 /DNA_ID=CAMNT_0040356921 /DNA_START=243 /DNA_END=1964 /DNA_ORIENTATION=+